LVPLNRPAIDLSNVNVVIDGKSVLRNLSWKVGKGDSWAIIGQNGAGKTTLLSLINGYRWPSTGQIAVFGKKFGDIDLRELRKKIGIVSSYLDGWIPRNERVLDLVISGKYASIKLWKEVGEADVRHAEYLLRLMSCLDLKNKMIKDVSEGERRKILIARAMMAKPKLLTLDEPCEGLDLKARETYLAGLSKLAKRRDLTIIQVTHRTDEIPESFTHALLLKSGKQLVSGPIDKVLTNVNLSLCFDLEVKVKKINSRYYTIVEKFI
jgi:iron complex transport system ATP-binding protein